MTDTTLPADHSPWDTWPHRARAAAATTVALGTAVVIAYLVGTGKPELALGLLLAVPAAQILLRRPLAAAAVWLLLTPLVVETDGGGALRLVFTGVHRAMPLLAVANVVLAAAYGVRRPLPRFTLAEGSMAAYLVITQLSILYTSDAFLASTIQLYDRVGAPMLLYLLVRFCEPDERHVRRLVPIVLVMLLTQTLVGALQWTAPGSLPSAWQNRIGLRTTGTLRHPNVYGTTMLFVALFLMHLGISMRQRSGGRVMLWLVPVAMTMVFLTYSRASWLAGVVVALGVFTIYPRYITKVAAVAIVASMVLIASGRVDTQIELAQQRFLSEQSEESALSRLPVIAASLRMLRTRPLTGWGYEHFDRYNRQFQGAVGGLVVPEKDHASHNLYLTLLAEQGLPGFLFYMGPFFYWLALSRTAWRTLPKQGVVSSKLLVCLWLMLASHVVVNNYSDMHIEWGLGLWWITLGLIATLTTRYHPVAIAEAERQAREGDELAAADRSELP
jgi:O-antigen ligase